MADIYSIRRRMTWLLIAAAAVVVALFMAFSLSLVGDLAEQERQRMELWADATRRLADGRTGDSDGVDFMLKVIESNRTIPLILADKAGNIIFHRNITLPEPVDSAAPLAISEANAAQLARELSAMRSGGNMIKIPLDGSEDQYLYYGDSTLLRRLSLYPYVQIAVMLAFVATVYFAVTATRKAEQNKVWVGLSKETAHQLGTPISSLMAWLQVLEAEGVDRSTLAEMDKDVTRLEAVASRFSKVGSRPALEPESPDEVIASCCHYMALRIPTSVRLTFTPGAPDAIAAMCAPLMQWVLENLIKNAVDAIDGNGAIDVTTSTGFDSGPVVIIDVSDTGRGLQKKYFKTIFRPGYTTRKRGWGLGLTLAKRIVDSYHHGRIVVLRSEPGKGTTFRITLPSAKK